ncbi:uncharacterized protein [Amphiura filiformis]|uniref:uncharacterized protein n=1 Tax=Amphiura filiformis TaxID=82378 RepID=UPI003B223E3E
MESSAVEIDDFIQKGSFVIGQLYWDGIYLQDICKEPNSFFIYFLRWQNFITKEHHLQKSQTTLQQASDTHQLNSAFVSWKHAYRCSENCKEYVARRQRVMVTEAFEEWRQWTLNCRADRHRHRMSLKKAFHTWKYVLQAQKHERDRLRPIIHHWRAKTRRNKEKQETVCQIQQAWRKRCLQSILGKWKDALLRKQKADEHYRVYVMRRIMTSWRQIITRKQSFRVLYTSFQTKSKRRHLKQGFRLWLVKYRHIESLNQCVDTNMRVQESVRLQQAFVLWKTRLVEKENWRTACHQDTRFVTATYFNMWTNAHQTKCAVKHHGKMIIRKTFNQWKEFVRISHKEKQHDQDLGVLADAHYQQRMCKQVLQLWHHEVLVEKHLTVRRDKLARKYSTLWHYSVAMQKTAKHMV